MPYACTIPWLCQQYIGQVTSRSSSGTTPSISLSTSSCWCLVLQVNAAEFFCHPVPLGDNLYNKNRPKVVPPARGADSTTDTQQKQAEQQPQEQSAQGASRPDKVSHPATLTDHLACECAAVYVATWQLLLLVASSARKFNVTRT